MDRTDYRSLVIAAIKATGRQVKMNGDRAQFRCVRHEDKNPSAWLGDWKWGCSSCGFEESIDTLAEHLGVEKPARHYTVEDYAGHKGFSLDLLQRWGVHTKRGKFGNDVVCIPYRDAEGQTLRSKLRTPGKTFWDDGNGTYLYGLDVLAKAKPADPVLLVEGESDCHAGWHKGVLTLGIPGANGWKREWAALLEGRVVYLWQEPDTDATQKAAEKLAEKVRASIPALRIIKGAPAKDLADLYKEDPQTFKARLRQLMDAAVSTEPAKPEVPRTHYTEVTGSKLEEILSGKLKPIDAVPTPFPAWNRACRDEGGGVGLARGWHITLAGNPGHGKSVTAINLVAAAVNHGESVCFNSLEMSFAQIVTRYMAIVSGETIWKLEHGDGLDINAHRRAGRLIDEIRERTGGRLITNERPIKSLDDVCSAIRFQYEFKGCRYAVTDYLQLCNVLGVTDRLEGITRVSDAIRGTAKELGIISIGLSQFNRETSKEYDEPPTIQGLMGGSPLENDSDQILLIDHSNYTRDTFTNSASQTLILGKNRHGGIITFPARWDYTTLRLNEVVGDTQPAPSTVRSLRKPPSENTPEPEDEIFEASAA